MLYSNRHTKVTTFLSALYRSSVIDHIRENLPDIWDTLREAWINFSHFTEEISDKEAFNSLTPEGLLAAFLRGRAIQCKCGQAGIDLVIPVALVPSATGLHSPVSVSDISAIIIQIKNKVGDEGHFSAKYTENALFDIRHINGLSDAGLLYVGIWMSFRAHPVDFAVQGCEGPLVMRPNGNISL
jgi:hypothetical protein